MIDLPFLIFFFSGPVGFQSLLLTRQTWAGVEDEGSYNEFLRLSLSFSFYFFFVRTRTHF